MTNPRPFLPLNPLQPAPLTRRDGQAMKSEFLAVAVKTFTMGLMSYASSGLAATIKPVMP